MVILDLQMPHMDELTLAAQLRKLPKCQILLIMLTSIGNLDNHAGLNFAAVLTKPVKRSHLYDILSHLNWEQRTHMNAANTTLVQLNSVNVALLPLQILLAEDNRVNQQVAIHMVQTMGYHVDVVNNGLEVLAALRRQADDVVLMDMQMPKMDCLTATRCICQEWNNNIRQRMIAMTANAMPDARQQCLDADIDDYLTKLIRKQKLAQVQTLEWATRTATNSKTQNSADSHPLNTAINLQVLQSFRKMVGIDAAVSEMIDCYLENAANLGNRTQLHLGAHTLKSSSATLSAIAKRGRLRSMVEEQSPIALSQLCKQLEAISFTVAQIQAFIQVDAALQLERQPTQV